MTREDIYLALQTQLQGINIYLASGQAPVVTWGRRLPPADDLGSINQPAVYVITSGEHRKPLRGFPDQVTLKADVWVFCNAGGDMHAVPATQLNYLLDALDAAVAPDPITRFQTLGGLVSHCWIEGDIVNDEGLFQGQSFAIVPFMILVPHLMETP